MTIDYELLELFPTTVYKKNMSLNPQDLNKMINNTEFERDEEAKCWISKDIDILESYPNTKKMIDDNFKLYVNDVHKIDTSDINFFICRSWIVKHAWADFGQEHYHANSIFSGVLYLKVDDDSGQIVFHKQREFSKAFDFNIKDWNKYNCLSWSILPKVGDLLIFPSTLNHSITTSLSPNLRYVLSFNYFFRGNVGSGIKKLTV